MQISVEIDLCAFIAVVGKQWLIVREISGSDPARDRIFHTINSLLLHTDFIIIA